MSRSPITPAVELAVLSKCRRRCALCFHLSFTWEVVAGQLAHIDRDPSKAEENDLAFLCQPHHDQYDTVPRQTKRLQPSELRTAKAALEAFMAENHDRLVLGIPGSPGDPVRNTGLGVSFELFEVRIPVYRALVDLLTVIFRDARVGDDELREYGRSIQDAVFLFDDEIDSYLREVYRQAIRLRLLQRRMGSPEEYNSKSWGDLVIQESAQLTWLTDQPEQARKRFVPYLRLAAGDRPTRRPSRSRPGQ